MASPAGFEPAWDGLEIRCLSIRLRGDMVGEEGIEPPTLGSSIQRSTS